MNLLPSLNRQHKTHFNNPLSGVLYDNTGFLRSCHYAVRQQQPQQTNRTLNLKHNSSSKKEKIEKYHKSFVQTVVNAKQTRNSNQQISKLSQTDHLNQSKAQQKERMFPNLVILLLDPIQTYQQISQKFLLTTFQRYFLSFFKKSLLGAVTPQFIMIVQQVIRNIIEKGQIDTPIDFKQYPTQIFGFKSKKKFIQKVFDFREKQLESWVQAIVKFYCIPSKQYRDSILRDVILTLVLQIYEKFNQSKQLQYVLLQENGQVILDVCQIYFSTTKLFLTNQSKKHANYLKYLRIVQEQLDQNNKLSFSEGIKRGFRKKIAKGNFEQYQQNSQIIEYFVKPQLEKAHLMMLHRKKSKQRIPRVKSVNSKSKSQLSKSHTSRNSHHINASYIRDRLSSHSKNQLKETQWKSSFENKIQQQFKKLQIASQKYDFVFNKTAQNENRLMMKALKKDFVIFKDKSQSQINRILKAMCINPDSDFVELQSFKELRFVIEVRGDRDNIMKFVGNYLPFNEYNELSAQGLRQTLSFVLDYKDSNVSVIQQVIWSWLDKNHLIEEDIVRKTTLESWYQHNKLVYMLMISMIFGTNEVTPLEMAYQILI